MEKTISLFEKFIEGGKHGIIFGIGTSLKRAISIILIPLYTTHLSTSDYGILGIILVTSSLLSVLFSLGLSSALFRSYYDYDDEKNRISVISTAFLITAFSCFVLFFFGYLFSDILSVFIFGKEKYGIHLLVVVIFTIFTILNRLPYTIFIVQEKTKQYAVFQFLFVAIGIVVIFYFVAIKDWGLLGVLYGKVIMEGFSLLILYGRIWQYLTFNISKLEAKKMLHFGIPLIPGGISAFVLNSSDRYILNFYSTLDEVGLYNLGYQFGVVMTVIYIAPIHLIWNRMYLSVKDYSNAKDFYSRALTYVVLYGSFLFLGLSLLSRELIHIFSKKEYWDAYRVVPLIALTYLIWGMELILNVGVGLKRKTIVVSVNLFIGAVINIVLNIVLIPEYGMMGAAYATLLSFIIMVVLIYYYNNKLLRIEYEWKRIAMVFFVVLSIFSIGYFGVNVSNIYVSILLKLLIVFLFPVVLYFCHFYLEEEIRRMKQIFQWILIKMRLNRTPDSIQ